MKTAKLIDLAVEELAHPAYGVTKQFLQIHQITHEAGKPVVAGVRVEPDNRFARVYFPVEGERFHFVVYVAIQPLYEVRGVDTEDYCDVYFRVTSEELTLAQVAALTALPADPGSWSKGEQRRGGGARRSYTSFMLRLPQAPGELDSKLKPLLTYLEQDAASIRSLAAQHGGHIQVHTIFHNGNRMLGGLFLDKEDIARLAALGLEIDFDLYAEGNHWQ